MELLIKDFIKLENKIRQEFKCDEKFFLKPMIGNKWAINMQNETYFLSYLDSEGNKNSCYIVNKNNKPLIYKKDDLTMVIAIDCIKIAFIFENKNKL